MQLYDLAVRIEELTDEGGYRFMATSADLPGLIVAGETVDEVLALVPAVAAALIQSLREAGDPMPATLRPAASLPFAAHVAVAA